jgi:2-oxoglutarate ferredoxin oxidoreductase subunit beta
MDTVTSPMQLVYKKPETLTDTPMHYCPGCGHGVVHRVLMEVVEEMGIQSKIIGVAPVGCSVFAYNYMNVDMQEAPHGRASAVATGIKRVLPEKYVFSYQGDGDLAAIGTGESIHTVNRGENILMLFINNAIYGMTGGQMAPTTILGQVTSTSPYGRNSGLMGFPLKMTELVAQLPGAYYVTRQSVHTAAAVRKLKKAI